MEGYTYVQFAEVWENIHNGYDCVADSHYCVWSIERLWCVRCTGVEIYGELSDDEHPYKCERNVRSKYG